MPGGGQLPRRLSQDGEVGVPVRGLQAGGGQRHAVGSGHADGRRAPDPHLPYRRPTSSTVLNSRNASSQGKRLWSSSLTDSRSHSRALAQSTPPYYTRSRDFFHRHTYLSSLSPVADLCLTLITKLVLVETGSRGLPLLIAIALALIFFTQTGRICNMTMCIEYVSLCQLLGKLSLGVVHCLFVWDSKSL